MTEYNYKQFKIHYNIHPNKVQNLYTADGYARNPSGSISPRKFHTEYKTKSGVQNEIKHLIENYIDFEWEEFYEVHGKSHQVRTNR